MDKSVRGRVLAQLSAMAIAASSGFLDAATSLLTIPESVLVDWVDDADDDPPQKKHVLSLLAKDARATVRERVALAAAVLDERLPGGAEKLIRELAGDPSPRVRAAVGRSLAAVLDAAPPLARFEIVGRWTLSPRASERAAVARALERRTPVFVSDLALEELSNDPDPEVRAHAARAMARRIGEAPDTFARTLTRLAEDPEPRVQRTARRLLAVLTAPVGHKVLGRA